MKIKFDHITNSSSVNFILSIKFKNDNFENFIEEWNSYINYFIEEHKFLFKEKVKDYKKYKRILRKKFLQTKQKVRRGEESDFEKYFVENCNDDIYLVKETDDEIIKKIIGKFDITMDELSRNLFYVKQEIIMLNWLINDAPKWIVYLVLMSTIDPKFKNKFGFKKIFLRVEDTH